MTVIERSEMQKMTCVLKIGHRMTRPWGSSLGSWLETHPDKQPWKRRRIRTPEGLFQCACSALWDCIPEFRSAEVDVVDTEKIHVFDVPSECRSPHPKVEVRGVYAR